MKKKLLVLATATLMFASVSSASAAEGKQGLDDGVGVFSPEIRKAVRELADSSKAELKLQLNGVHSMQQEEYDQKVFEMTQEKVKKKLSKVSGESTELQDYSDWVALIGKRLGPTEQAVCNESAIKCANVLVSAQLAFDTAQAEYTDLHNGKGDAFRHGFWQGLAASGSGIDYAKRFGEAHETDYPGPHLEFSMDTHNNYKGRELGHDKWFTWTVKSAIKDGIARGDFLYMPDDYTLRWTNQ